MEKRSFMDLAFEEADAAAERGEVPVGAVVVLDGMIIARAGNETMETKDPTAHAEIVAMRRAALQIQSERLLNCDLYVTLEPCTMCASAISHARIKRLYFAADDVKGGAVTSGVQFFNAPTCHHVPEIYSGIQEKRGKDMLKSFFAAKR